MPSRRTVAPYRPAKTPHVGRTVPECRYDRFLQPRPVVVIREAGGNGTEPGLFWVAIVQDDGALGPMTVAYVDTSQLPA